MNCVGRNLQIIWPDGRAWSLERRIGVAGNSWPVSRIPDRSTCRIETRHEAGIDSALTANPAPDLVGKQIGIRRIPEGAVEQSCPCSSSSTLLLLGDLS